MAVGIGHDHSADLALADVNARRPERGETLGLRLLVTVDRRARSKCIRSFPVFGMSGGPPQLILGPPWGERTAV